MNSAAAAKVLNVTQARVRQLCSAGRIKGARKLGRDWELPDDFRIRMVKQGRPLKVRT